MLKKLLLLLAATTTLFAAINLYFVILTNENTLLWRLGLGLISVLVICVGLWTWFYTRTDTAAKAAALLAGSGLILLSFAGAALAFFTGRATGDFEYYLFLIDALLVSQGTLTIFTALWHQNTLQNT